MSALGFQSYASTFNGQNTAPVDAPKFKLIKSVADVEAAVAAAKAAGKPVLIDFYADWCVACKEFENITFKDKQVQQRLSQYVLLKADVTKGDTTDNALLEHYKVLGLPTLLLFNQQGVENNNLRITGFMGPEAFSKHLDVLLTK